MVCVIVEKTAKPKLKAKLSEAPLVWQSKYEFVLPYNMDEAIRRINVLGDKYRNERQGLWRLFFPSENFGVDSQEDNGAVFNFKMSGSAGRVVINGELRGQLVYENDQQTRVKIQTGIKRLSIIELIIILPIMSVIFVLATHASNIFELLLALASSFAVFSLIALPDLVFGYPLKSVLYDDLREALDILPAPRPQILPP
jgi:hypothetical protein